MAKAIVLVASALFVLAIATSAQTKDFELEGDVYCDTCRVFFATKLSTPIEGAEVELTCKNRDNLTETFKETAVTKAHGGYVINVPGDHEDDVCEVRVVSSPDPECNEVSDEIDSVKVSLTQNAGIDSCRRYANAIGFLKKGPIADCSSSLKEMGYEWIDGKAPEDASD